MHGAYSCFYDTVDGIHQAILLPSDIWWNNGRKIWCALDCWIFRVEEKISIEILKRKVSLSPMTKDVRASIEKDCRQKRKSRLLGVSFLSSA